jgi:hypothetical protein
MFRTVLNAIRALALPSVVPIVPVVRGVTSAVDGIGRG